MSKEKETLTPEIYILVLQDEIARLRRWLDEIIRMHYRLDEPQNDVD